MNLLEYAAQFKMPFDPPRGGEEAYFEALEVAEGFLAEGGTGDLEELTNILTGAVS